MSEQIQELINKIKSEGVQVAEQQAKEIEENAQKKAAEIIAQAKKEKERLIAEAKVEAEKTKVSTDIALKQAARDMLLSLRKEIAQMLQKIVVAQIGDALSIEKMGEIIVAVALKYFEAQGIFDITVAVSEQDLGQFKTDIVGKLKDQMKKDVTVSGSADIAKGFTISFDQGKSSFDFTDKSLAEYLAAYVNQYVGSLLKEAV